MAGLGKINVSLGLDAAEYTRGLTRAEHQARKFGEEMGNQIRSGALIASGALSGLSLAAKSAFDFIKNQADSIDAFNDLADATGASIESISALDRVARETGSSFESASGILVKFNQALSNAKPDNDAGRLLKALNLDISELKSLDPAEALRRTAVSFQGFTQDGNTARAMQELFGKSVREAAPFLKDLAEKNQLVGTTSTAAAQQAETFNKQLFALQANATDASRAIASDLLPALSRAIANFTELKKQGNLGLIVKDAAKDVFGFGKLTGDNGADIKRFMKERDDIRAAMEKETRPLVRANDPRKAQIDELTRYLEIARTKQANDIAALYSGQDFSDAISRKLSKTATLKVPESATGGGGTGRSAAAIKDPYAEAARYIETLQKQFEATQQLTVQEQVLRDLQLGRLGAVTSAQKNDLLGIAGQIDAAKALTEQRRVDTKALEDQAAAQKALQDEGVRLYEEMRTPLEQFNAAQDKLNVLLEAGAIDFVTAARAGEAYTKRLQDATRVVSEMDEFAKNAAQSIQQTLGSGLANILDGNFKNIGQSFTQMLNRIVADALAADIARKLFGAAAKGGEGSGLFGAALDWFGGAMGYGGKRASGGNVSAGKFFEVNERGPELLDVGGRKLLMMGNQSGRITPNHQLGNDYSRMPAPIINVAVEGHVDRRTRLQIANDVGRSTALAMRRNG